MREEPRMLPPRAMMPSVSAVVSGRRQVLDQAAPAFEDADARAPLVGDLLHDGADDGVQTGQSPPPVSKPTFI